MEGMEYVGPGENGRDQEREATPAEHLDALAARAQNGFELNEETMARLGAAVTFSTELQSFWGAGDPLRPPKRSTYRHVFLLRDGSSQTLWELEYASPEQPGLAYELYTDPDALELAQRRANELIAGPGFCDPELDPWADGDGDGAVYTDHTERLIAAACVELDWPREYEEAGEGSADHARRVLRRAENPDLPDELTRRRLQKARAHEIRILPHKPTHPSGRGVWWRMYEHAFLLQNGDEIVLWELEHNMTPDRRLVCEVYADEDAAERAAQRAAQRRAQPY